MSDVTGSKDLVRPGLRGGQHAARCKVAALLVTVSTDVYWEHMSSRASQLLCRPQSNLVAVDICFSAHPKRLRLALRRSPPVVDRVPTMKTSNCRMCLLLATGQMGMLQIEDAERLQARLRRCCMQHLGMVC